MSFKVCECCRKAYSEEQWEALPRLGSMRCPADAFGPAERIELRNCGCGTTLAVETEVC